MLSKKQKASRFLMQVALVLTLISAQAISIHAKAPDPTEATKISAVSPESLSFTEKNEVILKEKKVKKGGVKDALHAEEEIVIPAKYGSPAQLSGVHPGTMKFIKSIGRAASESAQEYELYASITIAQAIVESGSGTSGLSRAPYYNLFGIKGSYNGNTVRMDTFEDDGSGNNYGIVAGFKSYPSIMASLNDHDNLLRNGLNGYYAGTWKENTNSFHDAAYALQGRYATDTQYASKLIRTIELYNLTRFDKPLSELDIEWLESSSLDPYEIPEQRIKKVKVTKLYDYVEVEKVDLIEKLNENSKKNPN